MSSCGGGNSNHNSSVSLVGKVGSVIIAATAVFLCSFSANSNILGFADAAASFAPVGSRRRTLNRISGSSARIEKSNTPLSKLQQQQDLPRLPTQQSGHVIVSSWSSLAAAVGGKSNLSPLPKGISPFEKSVAKGLDVQGTIRTAAAKALEEALKRGVTRAELEFPPLTGGGLSKTQFDDFDNLSELDANRDWCVQLAPLLFNKNNNRDLWLVLPDDKEVELAKREWTGQLYRKAAKFTSIRAATEFVLGNTAASGGSTATKNSAEPPQMAKAWGSTFASTMNKLMGGDGILADSSTLDDLSSSTTASSSNSNSKSRTGNRVYLVCQPGNGGPVEDWINVEKLATAGGGTTSSTTIVVNGALDKVRDGFYPALFFPALAKSTPFYKQFEAVYFLKPISDKGCYGWLYRVYPEPWQVVLQTAVPVPKPGGNTVMTVRETVASVSDKRPTYAQAVQALLSAAAATTPRQ